MHHLESECHSKRLICYLQGQGCSEGLYNQIMTVFVIATEFQTFIFTTKFSFFTGLLCSFPYHYQGLGSLSVASSAVMSVI